MQSYRLFLRETSHAPDATRFDCDADDAIHAIEQAANAYPDCEVLSVTLTSATADLTGMVFREDDNDYEVHPEVDEGAFWLSVANGSLLIRQRDGALMVEIYQRGREDDEPIAEVSAAFDQLRPSPEVFESLNESQVAAHKRFAPTADDLWRELTDVPVNDRDELDADFRHFKAGVYREEVWRWMEDVFPGFSVAKAQGHP